MAITLVSGINQQLVSSLRVSKFFRSPTVSRLIKRILGSEVSSSVFRLQIIFSLLHGSLSSLNSANYSHFVQIHLTSSFRHEYYLYTSNHRGSGSVSQRLEFGVSLFIIKGVLEVRRLGAVCHRVVHNHAILCIVFTRLPNHLSQVICAAIHAFFTHECIDCLLESNSISLCREDHVAFVLGKLITRFTPRSLSSDRYMFSLIYALLIKTVFSCH